jgi:membrane protease YdiL (CAAX protease family)
MTNTAGNTSGTLAAPQPTATDPAPPQYSLRRILGTWAAAAVPMSTLTWVIAPWLATTGAFDDPSGWFKALTLCLTAGLIWQFALVVVLVRREQKTLHWPVLKEALWLKAPLSPRTGRRGGWLWLIVVPLVLVVAAEEVLPTLPTPVNRDLGLILGTPEGQGFLAGNWGWFAVLVTMFVFNTVLGEELLFRGLLLPRMRGVFGRWDWAANGFLFAIYHLHVPWVIPQTLLVDTFVIAGASRRYRSALVGVAVHSAQSLYFTAIVLALVLRH